MIRVILPYHLRQLAAVDREVELDLPEPVTPRAILDALEARYPMLQGTLRDMKTGERRNFSRFFACEQDFSLDGMEAVLPEAVAQGREPFMIVGAMAGG